jgi:hypothetical protein
VPIVSPSSRHSGAAGSRVRQAVSSMRQGRARRIRPPPAPAHHGAITSSVVV